MPLHLHSLSTFLSMACKLHKGGKSYFYLLTLKASDIFISLCWLNFLSPDLCSSKTKWCVIHRPNSYLAQGCHFHRFQQLQTNLINEDNLRFERAGLIVPIPFIHKVSFLFHPSLKENGNSSLGIHKLSEAIEDIRKRLSDKIFILS